MKEYIVWGNNYGEMCAVSRTKHKVHHEDKPEGFNKMLVRLMSDSAKSAVAEYNRLMCVGEFQQETQS